MIYLIGERLARLVLVVVGATLVTFLLLRLAGDPASVLLPIFASPEQRQELREDLGLDRSLPEQYLAYLRNAAVGDLGESWKYREPASGLVLSRFPATLELVGAGVGLALVVSVALAILASTRAGGVIDGLFLIFSLVVRAIPQFWLGTLLILLFSLRLGWLPTSGHQGFESLIMPAVTIALFFIAEFGLVLRASMIEALKSDYVLAAEAKGMPSSIVVLRHAFRTSLNPLLSVVGVNIGALLGGTIIVENVFAWPGLGRLAVEAVSQTDYPVVQATVLLFAVTIALGTAIVDLLYGLIDPRIRRSVQQ